MIRPRWVAAAAAALLFVGAARAQDAAPAPTTATLTVTFTGLASDRGSVMIALFDGETTYGAGAPLRALQVKAAMPQTMATFEGLTPGRYAIKSFHDLDGDGKLGANPFGIPTEPYAFSNNAPVHMAAPTWAEAAFTIDAAGASQSIILK